MEWMEGLSDELKGNETLQGFDSVESLAKGHLTLVEAGSQPWTETFSDEFKTEENLDALKDYENPEAAARALVELKSDQSPVPEKPEDYAIPKADGVDPESEMTQAFIGWAHEAKLTQAQVDALVPAFGGFIAKAVADQAEADKQEYETAVTALKDLWKDGYKKNMDAANRVFGKLATIAKLPEEDVAAVKEKYGNDPRLMRIFHAVSASISEDTLEAGKKALAKEEQSTEEFLEKEVFKGG